MSSDGYVTITGRIKDLIIRGGENIHPLEIENCLLSNPEVSNVAVVGVPDERYGEAVGAFVVAHKNKGMTTTENEVKDWVRKRLSHHLGKIFLLFVILRHASIFSVFLLGPTTTTYAHITSTYSTLLDRHLNNAVCCLRNSLCSLLCAFFFSRLSPFCQDIRIAVPKCLFLLLRSVRFLRQSPLFSKRVRASHTRIAAETVHILQSFALFSFFLFFFEDIISAERRNSFQHTGYISIYYSPSCHVRCSIEIPNPYNSKTNLL